MTDSELQQEEFERLREMTEQEPGMDTYVFRNSRNEVVKVRKNPDNLDIVENLSRLEIFPETELERRDYTDLGFGEETAVIRMSASDMNHREAYQHYGQKSVEMGVNALDSALEHGVAVTDSKWENIHFYLQEEGVIAKPIDLFDSTAISVFHPMEAESTGFKERAASTYNSYARNIWEYAQMGREEAYNLVAQISEHFQAGQQAFDEGKNFFLQNYDPDTDSFRTKSVSRL